MSALQNSPSREFCKLLCLGTFLQGYAWTNKPCLLNPANSELSCMLPCFRTQLWLYLPAQAHPERDSACCQVLMPSGESWPGTQRKGVEEWGLQPGSQPSTLSTCDWVFEQQEANFSLGKALSLQTCHGLSGPLEEDVLPGTQPDSFSSAWGRERKFPSAPEWITYTLCFGFELLLYQLPFLPSRGYFFLFCSLLMLKSQELGSSLGYATQSENYLQGKPPRIHQSDENQDL